MSTSHVNSASCADLQVKIDGDVSEPASHSAPSSPECLLTACRLQPMYLSLPCTLSCRSTSAKQTPTSCRSSLRCKTPCAARTPLPRSCAYLCTTHMPTKRPLPHLQVARQTSLLNECIGSTQAARIADWAPSLVYLLRFDASMRASTLVNHLRICWSRH